jgi:potassium efflux system protein
MVPIETETKTIVPLTGSKQPPQMPPAAKLD